MSEKQLAVRLKGISKSFGPVKANQNVSFDIYRGEVLALLGENGSGKTTLMNMLSGIYFPDSGEIEIDGKHVSIGSPRDAFDYGIGMIHQHFKLINVFTAAENIVLGLKEDAGFDLNRVKARVAEICDEYGFVVDPDKKVYDMSVSEKQTVEIVKALYRGADILILDEPTAVLTPQETEKLFAVLRNMRDDGKAVVIITHKLQEVSDISDRVVVLRKGEYVGEMITAQSTADQMTEMMAPGVHMPGDVPSLEELTAPSDSVAVASAEPSGMQAVLSTLSNINLAELLVSFLVFFIFGYLLYASLFTAIGSAVENEGDSQQLQLPITVPLLLGFFIAIYAFKAPDSALVFWGSMIPFTSPIVMLARIPFGVPAWEIILSAVLLIATFAVCAWISAKIYKVGILMFGKKSTWKDLWKWFKQK